MIRLAHPSRILRRVQWLVDEAHRVLQLAVFSSEDQQKKFSDELAHLSQPRQQRDVLIGPGIVGDELFFTST